MSDTEHRLSEALRERADHTVYPGTPMGDIVTTARSIRRRRRRTTGITVVAGVIAVAAIPVGLSLGGVRTSPDRLPPTSTTRVTDPKVSLTAIAQGPAPAIAWLDGDDFVSATGDRTTLPLDGVTTATPYRGGYLAAITGPDLGPRVVLLDNELREVWRRCGQGGFAVSQDGTRTAYDTADCDSPTSTLHLGLASGMGDEEQTEQLPLERAIPVGILGHSVITGALPGGRPRVTYFDDDSEVISALGDVGGVDESLHLVSGQLAGDSSTGAAVDPDTGGVRWTAPGWYLGAFSPDGSKVLGTQVGNGSPIGWAVFDAGSGAKLHEFAQLAGFRAHATVWEDDGHLLMATTQGDTQAILRTTLDGAVQRASETAPYDGSSDTLGFRFAPRP